MKLQSFFAATFALLGLSAVLLLASVNFGNADTGWLNATERFIEKFGSIILSVGTIFLVTGLTLLATRWANASQERVSADNLIAEKIAARTELKIAKEIKLSEFRQSWINDLRDELSEYVSIIGKRELSTDEQARVLLLSARIRLRLNPKEGVTKDIGTHITEIQRCRNAEDDKLIAAEIGKLIQTGNVFLKHEWDELKRRLDLAMEPDGGNL